MLALALLGASACKPDAAAAGAPEGAPAPAVDPAVESGDAAASKDLPSGGAAEGEGATLAATNPSVGEAVGEPDAIDPPAEPAVAQAAPDEPPPSELTVPEEPYKVLILGDSLAATGIGALLERKLDAHPHVVAYRKGKSASGLARPDFFDWPAEAKRQIEFRNPNLVIVLMGGNDGQDLTRRPNGTGSRVAWKDEDWATAYRERVDELLAQVTGGDRRVLWIGLPQMGMRSLEKKLALIRDVQQNAVEALGDKGVYLDTIPFVTNDEGQLLETAPVGARGKVQTLRAEDGIHFTMAGSEYFADRVYPSVLEVLRLPDVEPEP